MKKIIIVIFHFFICFNFFSQNKVIEIKQEFKSDINLDFSYLRTNLRSLDWSPILKKKIIEIYKGIPLNDSINYYIFFEYGFQGYYDYYKKKEFQKEKFYNYLTKNKLDTLKLSKKPLIQGMIAIIGFHKNKQFIIADLNRNEDFGDDNKYEFDINFRENPDINIINNLPKSQYSYERYVANNIFTYTRNIVLFPDKTQPYSLDKKEYEYSSRFIYKDYWKGTMMFSNKIYEFYYQCRDNDFGAFYIKPKTVSFSIKDEVINNQYMHYTKDTVNIEGFNYKLDSVNRNISKLYLTKLGKTSKKYGNTTGRYINQLFSKDLQNNTFSINQFLKEKKYTLIEFWGTWCTPCIEMTPKLIDLDKNNNDLLNIISIAKDKNINVVGEYLKKNNITWRNGFVDINAKERDPILKNLSIFQFPTFILLNSKGKILHRGGPESFSELQKLIK